jgi:sugar phosphate isomerase/epimerase
MKTAMRAAVRPVRGSDAHPLEWAFQEAAKLGFDGLELILRANRWGMAGSWTEQWKAGAKSLMDQYDVQISSLCAGWAWAYAAIFPALSDWDRGLELIGEDAKLARELGADTILIHFGTSSGSWEECRDLLRGVAAAGEENGVAFGFEANIWENTGKGDFQDLLRMVDEVGSDYFGVYLHNGYPRAGLPLHEEIEAAGDRLVKSMHSSLLTTGQVEIDFEKAFAAMKKYFAGGMYTFEIAWEHAEENKKVIDEMIAKYW